METTQLRPLTLGEILDRTAQLYRTNFLLFAGIFAVTNCTVLLIALVPQALSPEYRQAVLAGGKIHTGLYLLILGSIVLFGMLLYGASIAALTRAVAWVHMGEPATIRRAYASTLPRLGRYLWLMVLTALLVLGIALLAGLALGIVMAIAIFAIAALSGGSRNAAFAAGVVVGLLFDVGLFVVTAWVAARYALGIPACVVENLKARKALRRSVELSKESRGRIFVLFLLVGVIQVGLLLLTQGPFFLFIFKNHGHLTLGLNIVSQIVSVATNTLVGPILAAGLTLFYFDQRVRKEGYDIEWMMQAAGMTQPVGLEQAAGLTLTGETTPDATTAAEAQAPQTEIEAHGPEAGEPV